MHCAKIILQITETVSAESGLCHIKNMILHIKGKSVRYEFKVPWTLNNKKTVVFVYEKIANKTSKHLLINAKKYNKNDE